MKNMKIKKTLLNLARNEARRDPLTAAFLGWLLQYEEFLALTQTAAAHAANAKSAQRTSQTAAILGFACGIKQLKPNFTTAFATQLEWLMGLPNYHMEGEPSSVVADPMILAGIMTGAGEILDATTRQKFDTWSTNVRKDAKDLIEKGSWQQDLIEILTLGKPPQASNVHWIGSEIQIRRGEKAIKNIDKITDGFEAGMRLAAIIEFQQRKKTANTLNSNTTTMDKRIPQPKNTDCPPQATTDEDDTSKKPKPNHRKSVDDRINDILVDFTNCLHRRHNWLDIITIRNAKVDILQLIIETGEDPLMLREVQYHHKRLRKFPIKQP
jgi:hypothetical protein